MLAQQQQSNGRTPTAGGMSARVMNNDSSTSSSARPTSRSAEKGAPKGKVLLSRAQLLAGLVLAAAAVLIAVLITYTVTREALSRRSAGNASAGARHGQGGAAGAPSDSYDQYET